MTLAATEPAVPGAPTTPFGASQTTAGATIQPQVSGEATNMPSAVPTTFETNLPNRTSPNVVQNSLVQVSDTTNTEIAKENVSDFLVSQAQNRINEGRTQSGDLQSGDLQSGDLIKKDDPEIKNNIEDIQENLANINENINLLAVAITDKSGNIDSALNKVDDAATLPDDKEAISEKISRKETKDDTVEKITDNEEHEDATRHSKTADNSMPPSDETEDVTKRENIDEEPESTQSDTSVKTGTTNSENGESENEMTTTSETSPKTEPIDKNGKNACGLELSPILQELKKVNDTLSNMDDKLNNLNRNVGQTEQLTNDEVKKK